VRALNQRPVVGTGPVRRIEVHPSRECVGSRAGRRGRQEQAHDTEPSRQRCKRNPEFMRCSDILSAHDVSPFFIRKSNLHCYLPVPLHFDLSNDSRQTSPVPSWPSEKCHPGALALSRNACPDIPVRASASCRPTISTSPPHSGHQARIDRRRRMVRTLWVSTVISVLLWATIRLLQRLAHLRNRDGLLGMFWIRFCPAGPRLRGTLKRKAAHKLGRPRTSFRFPVHPEARSVGCEGCGYRFGHTPGADHGDRVIVAAEINDRSVGYSAVGRVATVRIRVVVLAEVRPDEIGEGQDFPPGELWRFCNKLGRRPECAGDSRGRTE